MSATSNQRRLARLQRECDVSIAPVLMQLAICAALVLALGFDALQDELVARRAVEQAQAAKAPST